MLAFPDTALILDDVTYAGASSSVTWQPTDGVNLMP